jgi:hypothetical protein
MSLKFSSLEYITGTGSFPIFCISFFLPLAYFSRALRNKSNPQLNLGSWEFNQHNRIHKNIIDNEAAATTTTTISSNQVSKDGHQHSLQMPVTRSSRDSDSISISQERLYPVKSVTLIQLNKRIVLSVVANKETNAIKTVSGIKGS